MSDLITLMNAFAHNEAEVTRIFLNQTNFNNYFTNLSSGLFEENPTLMPVPEDVQIAADERLTLIQNTISPNAIRGNYFRPIAHNWTAKNHKDISSQINHREEVKEETKFNNSFVNQSALTNDSETNDNTSTWKDLIRFKNYFIKFKDKLDQISERLFNSKDNTIMDTAINNTPWTVTNVVLIVGVFIALTAATVYFLLPYSSRNITNNRIIESHETLLKEFKNLQASNEELIKLVRNLNENLNANNANYPTLIKKILDLERQIYNPSYQAAEKIWVYGTLSKALWELSQILRRFANFFRLITLPWLYDTFRFIRPRIVRPFERVFFVHGPTFFRFLTRCGTAVWLWLWL